MTETPPPSELVEAPSYGHINQNDPRYLEDAYFGEALKLPDGGMCWAASLAMCISAHSGLPANAVLTVVGRFVYELLPRHLADIQEDIRMTYGNDSALPFVQEGRYHLVTRNGGLDPFFLQNYPTQTEALLRYMLNDSLELNLDVVIPIRLTALHNSPEDLITELLHLEKSKTCVMAVGIEEYKGGKTHYANHMVYVAGIEKAEQALLGLKISDPNYNAPFWLRGKDLEDFLMGLGYKSVDAVGTVYMVRRNPTPLIWISTPYPQHADLSAKEA